MSAFRHIGVLGAGAWGSALANVAARAGRRVTLWTRDPRLAETIAQRRQSPKLPGVRLEDSVAVTGALEAVDAAALLVAVPAQALRSVARALAPVLRDGIPVIACAKGIERGTGRFMTEVIAECIAQAEPAILSGPSFAADVARGLPTAVTLAARDERLAGALAGALGSPMFRPYRFAELVRFGKAFGAKPETLTGLSGLGDLILTCSSRQSRNFSLGIALGEGRSLEEAQRGKLVEGIFTASVLSEMANARGIDMPIAAAVAAVLDGRLDIDAAIESLLTRPFRAEG